MKDTKKKDDKNVKDYRFDITQSDVKGLVAIDAIVPQWVADRMLALLATI